MVTGVGFRYAAVDFAEQFPSLEGYIRNLYDGEVEAIVQGDKAEVDQMIEWLKHGPSYASVESCCVLDMPHDSTLEPFGIGR